MNTHGFFDTPERITAWVFRTLITLVGATGTAVLWMAWGSLQDVKTDLKHNAEIQWQAITTLTANQNQAAATAAVMSTTLADHIKQEAQVLDDIHAEVKDHETRIRTLEVAKPLH